MTPTNGQQTIATSFTVGTMTRAEMDTAVEWAAKEGWNPGLCDAEAFYNTDPQGFFTARSESGDPLGFISAVKYPGETGGGKKHSAGFGFIGFFIVRPDLRGGRIGIELGRAALSYLAGCHIGVDGVLDKVRNYEAFGFRYAYRNYRYRGVKPARTVVAPDMLPIAELPLPKLAAYDHKCFPAQRHNFLKLWTKNASASGFACYRKGSMEKAGSSDTPQGRADRYRAVPGAVYGYGVIRQCRKGYKVGPLFAESAEIAEDILLALLSTVPEGAEFLLDVPERNNLALALARKYGMTEVFGTARMYMAQPSGQQADTRYDVWEPELPMHRIFGVTSFELG